jgi:hypothetical protein
LKRFVKFFKDIPSLPTIKLTDKKIKGTMSETYHLIIVMPYIVLQVEEKEIETDLFRLLLTLIRITRLVTAPEISFDQVAEMSEEINEYFRLRQLVFPEASLIPKHHFLKHYPELTRQFGPLSKFWTFHFEHKHQYFKLMMEHAKNLINETKLLAERHQLFQATKTNDRFPRPIKTNSVKLAEQTDSDIVGLDSTLKFKSKLVIYNSKKNSAGDYILFQMKENGNIIRMMKIVWIFIDEDYKKIVFYGNEAELVFNNILELYEIDGDFEAKLSTVKGEELLISKPVIPFLHNGSLFLSLPYTFPITNFSICPYPFLYYFHR